MLLSVSSVMGIAIDVLIIGLLLIFGFIGFRKGFFKSIISLFSTLVVLILSFCFAGGLAKLINKMYDFTGLIADKLCKGIADMHSFYSQTIPAGMSGKDLVNNIPASTNGFLKKLMSYVLNPLSAADVEGATVAEIVSGSFASVIMLIISAIILFIAIKIVLAIASRLFDNITRNRVFGATNKLLGFAFGAAKGLLVVLVFTVVLTFLTVMPAVNTKMMPIIQDNTHVAKPIYNTTDKFIEKHVIDGKLIQNWIDDLWENKYKGRGDKNLVPDTSPNGTVERPYIINLVNNESVYTATVTIDFTVGNEVYYSIDATVIDHGSFALGSSNVTEIEMLVYDSADMETALDIANLTNDKTYILKFTKIGTENNVQTILMLK